MLQILSIGVTIKMVFLPTVKRAKLT